MCKLRTFLRSYSMASVAGTTSYIHSISTTSVATPCQTSNAAARRTEAMHELLSSERKYACDLALVCGLHIPLAQGKPVCVPGPSTFSVNSRLGPSSPALSASSSSTNPSQYRPPMTSEDVRIVFRNISDIERLSSRFVKRLETVIDRASNDSGVDEDKVGELFLEIIQVLEPLYKTYVMTHLAALAHFSRLSSSPTLWSYLSSDNRIPDLPSFLMRPAQRIPEYCRLLGSIIDTTPASHRDLTAPLSRAYILMEKIAREISTTSNGINGSTNTDTEIAQLAQLESRLDGYSIFLGRLAEHIKCWENETRRCVESLQRWSITFGAVLGLPPLSSASYPPAYKEFTSLLFFLSELCTTLEMTLDPLLHKLEAMTEHPKRLLEEMHTLESLRTPSSLFARFWRPNTSKRYHNLQSELSSQLPVLLDAMDRAIGLAVRIMTQEFLEPVRGKWIKLFDSLREANEHYGGAEETSRAWRGRWEDGWQMFLTWREGFILRESTVRGIHSSARSDLSLPVRLSVTSAEPPSANDVPSVSPAGSPPRLQMRFSFPPSSSRTRRSTVHRATVLYTIRVLRSYSPPPHSPYRGHSFFTLVDGDCFEVLEEYDHPAIHADLPRCFVSKRDQDCLLKVRARNRGVGYEPGDVGWALARFVSAD
ncbi:Dbl homology domain-containing protein [Boletus coccyginus]|nr:Dbl homology domain-containing protein [Boletus coccyginus]